MLLRAGIGPVGHLRDLGIAVRASRPGVGQRLMDHPSISVASFLKPGARENPYSKRSLHLGMRFSSGIEGAPPGDMALTVSNKSAWHADRRPHRGDHALGEQDLLGNRPGPAVRRRIGGMSRRSTSICCPIIATCMRLARGFRQIAALHELPPLKADHLRRVSGQLHRQDPPGRHLQHEEPVSSRRIGATLMDGPAFLRQFIIHGFIMELAGLVQALRDDDALEAYIRRAAVGVWHCSCSCRMGSEDDPMAVTDDAGPGPRRARTARGRRVDFPGSPVCQHQLSDHDGGGENCRRHAADAADRHDAAHRSLDRRSATGTDVLM